jgi:chromosome segregation ATPase
MAENVLESRKSNPKRRTIVMSRLKRTSKELEKARERANNLKSIDANLDLGSGMTLAAYQAGIASLQANLETYNNQVSALDAQANDLLAQEKAMAALSERMLDGVSLKYGKDSNAYEQAGGVRKSERKKPVRKPKTTS